MSYQLSTSDLDPILAAIETRFAEAKPSAIQVFFSKLLLIVTFGFVLTYVLHLIGISALIGADALVNLALFTVGLQLLSMLFSWRYLPVVKRQRRLYRDLDLIAPDPTPGLVWKKRTANERALVRGAVGTVLVGILGAVALNWVNGNLDDKELPPLIAMLGLICASAYWIWSDRKIPLRIVETLLLWIKFALLVGVAAAFVLAALGFPWQDWTLTVLVVLWPAWLLVKSRQVARIQERFAPLARAGGLRESLLERRREAVESGSDLVSLKPEDVAGLAYAENEMIRQDRVEAISESKIERSRSWSVSMSERVRLMLRTLEPGDRLKIQDAVSSLAASGVEPAADEPESLHTLEVQGTSIRLRYRLDDERRRVKVVELVSDEARADG